MTPSPAVLPCPRCHVPLTAQPGTRILLHGCPRCGGLLLDVATSARFAELIDPPLLRAAARVEAGQHVEVDTRPGSLPCPVCQRAMTRRPMRVAGVDLDVCADHGTWFDHHELPRVATALRGRRPAPAGPGPGVGAAATAAVAIAAIPAVASAQQLAAQQVVVQQQAQLAVQIDPGAVIEVAVHAVDVAEVGVAAGEVAAEAASGVAELLFSIFG